MKPAQAVSAVSPTASKQRKAQMIDRGLRLGMAMALAGFMANVQVARAGCDNGIGNGGVNNGVGNGACSANGGGSSDEAPLPVLGTTPLALMALGGVMAFTQRRKHVGA
jgi:hypothetical protein